MMLSICSEIDLPFNVLNLMLNKNSRKNNLSFSGPVTKALPSIPPLSGFFAASLRMLNKSYVWFLSSRYITWRKLYTSILMISKKSPIDRGMVLILDGSSKHVARMCKETWFILTKVFYVAVDVQKWLKQI